MATPILAPRDQRPQVGKPYSPAEWVDWREFNARFDWQQGEHVTAIGPTGAGKTTMLLRFLPRRDHVVIFGTKPEDSTMEEAIRAGYKKMPHWVTDLAIQHRYVVLWPPVESLEGAATDQAREFRGALNSIFRSRGWCVCLDEVAYLADELRMQRPLRMLWQMARSCGISIVAATQRPAYIPRAAYDQATHLFFWNDSDRGNLQRIGEIGGGVDTRAVMEEVANLGDREVLYVRTRLPKMTLKTTVEV